MRVLEICCGTKSIGKVFGGERGWSVVSIDIDPKFQPDILTDILTWDYKSAFNPGEFDVVWGSPPCRTFSSLRRSCVNQPRYAHITRETILRDIEEEGLPVLRKVQEIIEYFQPKLWFIENPYDGSMKDYIAEKPLLCAYCAYGYPYRKRTAIWTNSKTLSLLNCPHKGQKHQVRIGGKEDRSSLLDRYSIPPDLVRAIADDIEKNTI